MRVFSTSGFVIWSLLLIHPLWSADWPGFRGPAGMGISEDKNISLTWSDTKNIQWKIRLPGPGSSSPIVYGVIVNASEESVTLYALDKKTGKEVWKLQSGKLELTFGTPLLVDLKDGRKELLIAVPFEVWGFDPASGKCNWYAGLNFGGNISPSVIAQDGIVYATGGFPRIGSAAIRIGGKDDVTDTHTVWSSQDGSYVPSPVIYDGHIYWVSDRGEATCLEATSGKQIYKEKLEVAGRGKLIYASVVLVADKLYAVSRWGGTYVIAAKPKFELLFHNKIESDPSDFNSSPAISDGQIFLRSNQSLYCIQKK